ncbi:MAG: DUF2226 domain-containing protein [Archaeoglobaceae archaeon]
MPQIRPMSIERGRSYEIIGKLGEQNFTGLLRVSFKTDEISKSEILVENGTPIAMETKKIRSGKVLRGNKAFQDFINAENCVAEFYLIEIRDFLSSFGVGSKLDFEKILEAPEKIEREQTESYEMAILEKAEFDSKKLEMVKLLDLEFGKIAKKYIKLIESTNSLEELLKARNMVFEFLDSTTNFLPKEKVARVKSEIDRILESMRKEKLEVVKEKEFEEFKKDLISKFDRVLGSRELREILEKLEDWSDLMQMYPQIKKVASKFATVIPWNKVEEMLRMIEERLAEETGTKRNVS